MALPYLTSTAINQLRSDHDRLMYLLGQQQAQLRAFHSELSDGSSGTVAYITQVLPGRVGDTPGGPVTATVLVESGGVLVESQTVDVYSWVKSDTPDPADEPDGKLRIFMSKGIDGLWWMHAIDCTEVPASVQTASFTGSLAVTTTLQAVPTTPTYLTITAAGVYQYNFAAEFTVVQSGNQLWDIDIGLFNVTEGTLVFSRHLAGAGTPAANPHVSASGSLELVAADVGDNLALGVVRETTNGTVTLVEADHQIMGPVK